MGHQNNINTFGVDGALSFYLFQSGFATQERSEELELQSNSWVTFASLHALHKIELLCNSHYIKIFHQERRLTSFTSIYGYKIELLRNSWLTFWLLQPHLRLQNTFVFCELLCNSSSSLRSTTRITIIKGHLWWP